MKSPSIRHMKYAYGLMNENKTKQQIALEAGFSPSTARVPQVIESRHGHSLALAKLTGNTESAMLKLIFELNKRDFSKESTESLIDMADDLSRVVERLMPKNKA